MRPGEVGPNGHRVGYTKAGDKVEWIPDEENPGKEFPMILRRNDNTILKAEREFMDVIWYDRKLVLQQNLKEGIETIDPKIKKRMLAAMRATEKKYGKKRLRNCYHNDFEWGMLNGKLSALRWVLGDEWDIVGYLGRFSPTGRSGTAIENLGATVVQPSCEVQRLGRWP